MTSIHLSSPSFQEQAAEQIHAARECDATESEMSAFNIVSDLREYAQRHGVRAAHLLIDEAAKALNEQWMAEQREETDRQFERMRIAGMGLLVPAMAGDGGAA